MRLPLLRLGRTTADGIPYLVPGVVLLYKAKNLREHDELDFDSTLPTTQRDAEDVAARSPGHRAPEPRVVGKALVARSRSSTYGPSFGKHSTRDDLAA